MLCELCCLFPGFVCCELSRPIWYPIIRMVFEAACPSNSFLSILESGSTICCCGFPPSLFVRIPEAICTGASNCLCCTGIGDLNMGATNLCLAGLTSFCSFGWIAEIGTDLCSSFQSICSAWSPWGCLSTQCGSWIGVGTEFCTAFSLSGCMEIWGGALSDFAGSISKLVVGICPGKYWAEGICSVVNTPLVAIQSCITCAPLTEWCSTLLNKPVEAVTETMMRFCTTLTNQGMEWVVSISTECAGSMVEAITNLCGNCGSYFGGLMSGAGVAAGGAAGGSTSGGAAGGGA